MKIRFFLLGIEAHSSFSRFDGELKQLFADFIEDNGEVSAFSGMKDATTEIAKAVSEAHALVFVADTTQFGTVKQMLSKAFGFELTCDSTLLERACDEMGKNKEDEDYAFSVNHAFIAPNSRVFVLDDGLYAGFSVANGNQTIIVLPYEKARTTELITSQVVPYLNSVYHVNIDTGVLKKYYSEKLFELLEENSATIAVANTSTASFLKEYIDVSDNSAELVKFSPVSEKRGDMPPVDYVVNLSIVASEFFSCRYGVAISSAYYTGEGPESEKIVYIAVTNERETSVREIHSFKGEAIPAFLSRCCSDLIVFISDVIRNDALSEEDYAKREKAAKNRYKIAIAGVSGIIVALIAFVSVYFMSNDYSLGQWTENFMEWVFPAGNPFEGMFEKFAPGDDENRLTGELNSDEASTDEKMTEEASSEEETTESASSQENVEDETTDAEENTSQDTVFVG